MGPNQGMPVPSRIGILLSLSCVNPIQVNACLECIHWLFHCVCPTKTDVARRDSIIRNSRHEIVISDLHSFMIGGLIDLPTEFSEDYYVTICQEIFKKAFHCKAAKSASMAISGSIVFPANSCLNLNTDAECPKISVPGIDCNYCTATER